MNSHRSRLLALALLLCLTPPALAECLFAKAVLNSGVVLRAVNALGQAAALVAEPGPSGGERMTGYVWDRRSWFRLRGPAESPVALPQAMSANGRVAGSGGARGFLVTPVTVEGRQLWYLDRDGDGRNDLLTSIGSQGVNTAVDVNDQGDVAGTQWSPTVRAYIWNEAEGLRLIEAPGAAATVAVSVTEAGDVLGNARFPDGKLHAFVWSRARGVTDLGDLGGGVSVGRAMNKGGRVVGWSLTAEGQRRGFLWTPGEGMRDLGSRGVAVEALALNDRDEVAGAFVTAEEGEKAFVWTREAGFLDMGGGCAGQSRAISIGDDGLVAGVCSQTPGSWQAVVWTGDGSMLTLEGRGSSLQSAPVASSASGGHIAGEAWGEHAGDATAVLWTVRP